MLTKQNTSIKAETIIWLRATKAAMLDYCGVQNVPITLDLIKVVKQSHHIYTEHLRQEAAKKNTKETEKQKRSLHIDSLYAYKYISLALVTLVMGIFLENAIIQSM